MKCDECGKEITTNYVIKSVYDELEFNNYCSIECTKADNEVIREAKKRVVLEAYRQCVNSAVYDLLDIIEITADEDVLKEFNKDYPNLAHKLAYLNNWIKEELK